MKRKEFLGLMGLLSAGITFPEMVSGAASAGLNVGVQLWSLTNFLKEDFDGTIAQVANMGFNHVESAGYNAGQRTIYGCSPSEYSKKIKSHHLNPASAHAAITPDIADAVLDDFVAAGVQYLVVPSLKPILSKNQNDWLKAAAALNEMGKKAKKRGIALGYHNHDFEFVKTDKGTPYDSLLVNTDPEYVFFQMDIGWVVKSGNDPISYFDKYPGRFRTWHIRDVDNDGKSVTVGTGKVNFREIIAKRGPSGLKLAIMETPQSKTDGLLIAQNSFSYIKNNRIY